MGDLIEIPDPSNEPQSMVIVDFTEFCDYLRKAVTILLPEENAVCPALNVALLDRANQECIRKFLSDPQVQALYIQRSCSKDEESDQPSETEEEKDGVLYFIAKNLRP